MTARLIVPNLVKVTLVQIFLWMLVLPRWFSSPMWRATEALPPSTLTSMHWRWNQQSAQKDGKDHKSFCGRRYTKMRWKSLEFPVASSSMWGPYSIWNLILTFLLMTNLTSARAIWGPDWNCQRDPSCETRQWLRAHLPTLCQVLKPSNPQTLHQKVK